MRLIGAEDLEKQEMERLAFLGEPFGYGPITTRAGLRRVLLDPAMHDRYMEPTPMGDALLREALVEYPSFLDPAHPEL